MTVWQAILLGVVQGLTEFLPVSSSAHLIVVPKLLGWPDQGLSFDVAAHLGTFGAVLIYFRRDLWNLVAGSWRTLRGSTAPVDQDAWRLAWRLALATVPLAIIGFLAKDWAETQARNALLIAITSFLFGVLLLLADRYAAKRRAFAEMTTADAVIVGCSQALAVVPGVSRSGATITIGLARGLDREAAARLAFLLFVPASLLVAAKHVLDLAHGKVPTAELLPMGIGFVASFVSGFAVIGWLLGWVRRRTLAPFAWYRCGLGVLLFVLWMRGWF
jgi:undecaprenyl-diphosphatase